MHKKMIAFDLDDTLAITKQPITPTMSKLLTQLISTYYVAIITGGTYAQINSNVIEQLHVPNEVLTRFHFLPVSGAHHYYFELTQKSWVHKIYAPDLSSAEQGKVMQTIESAARRLNFWDEAPTGAMIDNRGSQITYSGLGQLAPPKAKYAWDPDRSKRFALQAALRSELPDFEVNINGNTSIDVSRPGVDKGLGMSKLLTQLSLKKSDALFIGDQLELGGNDYPVKALGVDVIHVTSPEQTQQIIAGILEGTYV